MLKELKSQKRSWRNNYNKKDILKIPEQASNDKSTVLVSF